MATMKITKANIERKINRQRKPVTSVVELAEEFGVNTRYRRASGARSGTYAHRAPVSFVNRVKAEIGTKAFNKLRRSQHVNIAYR